jgi:hypothetical protein
MLKIILSLKVFFYFIARTFPNVFDLNLYISNLLKEDSLYSVVSKCKRVLFLTDLIEEVCQQLIIPSVKNSCAFILLLEHFSLI